MAGSGKSTFSRALSARTGLPLIHLDLHFWKPGWVEPSDDEWRDRQRSLLAGDAWIADGNYDDTLALRLERADTVVYLDTPWWICAMRALGRGVRRRPPGAQLPEGCDETFGRRLLAEWAIAWRVWRVKRHSERARELAIVAQHGQHATLHMLRSKREARELLEGLNRGTSTAGGG